MPLGLGAVPPRAAAGEREHARALRPRRAARAAEPLGQAPAQEPARADRRARADPRRAPPAARAARLPDLARGRAARARARSASTTTCASRAGSRGEELEGLWAIADAFVFPSLYEGFGLPVLEAMARGVPVACSNASSLPEVAGDAALLFDPRDATAIAGAIERLLGDPALRERSAPGLARAREFTWERTARLTLDSYARALGSPVAARRARRRACSRRRAYAARAVAPPGRRSSPSTVAQRVLERQPLARSRRTTARCSRAAPARLVHPHDRVRDRLGVGASGRPRR